MESYFFLFVRCDVRRALFHVSKLKAHFTNEIQHINCPKVNFIKYLTASKCQYILLVSVALLFVAMNAAARVCMCDYNIEKSLYVYECTKMYPFDKFSVQCCSGSLRYRVLVLYSLNGVSSKRTCLLASNNKSVFFCTALLLQEIINRNNLLL